MSLIRSGDLVLRRPAFKELVFKECFVIKKHVCSDKPFERTDLSHVGIASITSMHAISIYVFGESLHLAQPYKTSCVAQELLPPVQVAS